MLFDHLNKGSCKCKVTASIAVAITLSVLAAGLPSRAQTVNDTELTRASILIETGKPDSAAVLLFDMLDSIDNNDSGKRVRTLYYLAQSMEQLGRLAEQINYLIMAREAGMDSEYADDVRFAYARILLETGNLDDCIGVIREFEKSFGNSPLLSEMLFIAGNANLEKEDYLRASNIFNEIVRSFPESDAAKESIMKEGICLYNLDLINGAIERLNRYLIEFPGGGNTHDALYYLGLSYERNNQPDQAVSFFSRLVVNFPSYPEAMDVYFKTGKHLFNTGRFAESENSFENYVFNTDITDENYDEAVFFLERIKFRTGRYSRESDIAENFIVKYPESPRTPSLYFDLARYYNAVGKIEDAVEKYRVLVNNTLYSAYADSAIYMIADTYTENGDPGKASLFLIQIADETVDVVRAQKAYYKLGTINEALERHNEAIGCFDKVLSIDGSSQTAYLALRGISRTFKSMNRWYEAAKTMERIIEEYPDRPDFENIYMEISDIYFLQGRIADAIGAAETGWEYSEGERKNTIMLYIAELYEEIDEGQALTLYASIYDDNSNPPEQRTKALMKFGDLSLSTGDSARAWSAYAKVLNENADSVSVFQAKEIISRMGDTFIELHTAPQED